MISRRTFLAALGAIPLAGMLPSFVASPLAASGGPFKFKIAFPDGMVFLFNATVCNAHGPVDLTQLAGEQELFLSPVGEMKIEQDVGEAMPTSSVAVAASHVGLYHNGVEVAEIAEITAPSLIRAEGIETSSRVTGIAPGLFRRSPITFRMNFQS